jgi:hypothetical protein
MRLWVLVTTTGLPPLVGRAEASGLGSLPLPDTYPMSANSGDERLAVTDAGRHPQIFFIFKYERLIVCSL